MARPTLPPLMRKARGRTAKPGRAARSVERIGRQDLIERRDRCMAAIACERQQQGESGTLFEKARQLLTRHWSVASWHARADILRTAEWLVGAGSRGSDAAEIAGHLESSVAR